MNWKIGQKLVCISTQVWSVGFGPKKDEVVTLAEVGVGFYTGREILHFHEYNKNGAGYYPEYFRPVDDTVTYDDLYEKFGSPERLDSLLRPTVKIPQTA